MTLVRDPLTWADAATKVSDIIGWAEVARLMGLTERAVQFWGQPNHKAKPTLDQAVLLDTACRLAGSAEAPFMDLFASLLDIQVKREVACQTKLAEDSAAFVREAGELGAALFQATRPGASRRDHNRALVEAQQVETALGALMRRLPSFLQFGAGSLSGNYGGSR
jgi:hypothetical protein